MSGPDAAQDIAVSMRGPKLSTSLTRIYLVAGNLGVGALHE